MTSAAIQLTHLRKSFGQLLALDDVSLAVPGGEVWGLLGHNGAGKTTLIKHLLGLLVPTSGTVEVLGHPALGPGSKTLRRDAGYLPETVAFYPELTGRETLAYFARLKGADGSQCQRLLSEVDLTEAADRRVKTYSNGMRKRLGLAQALLGKPRLLLLDEPTAGLDPIATQKFFRTVANLAGAGVTVLLSSHVLPGIEKHVDRVAILGAGRLLAAGTLGSLREAARLPIVVRVRTNAPEQIRLLGEEPIGASVRRISGQEFEVKTSQHAKLDVLRAVLAQSGVIDLSVRAPTLDAIYAHYYSAGDATRAERMEGKR